MGKNKLYSMVLSLAVAMCLWLYVSQNVSIEEDNTFSNIPVVMEGESVLNERNLMVTSLSNSTVSLHLTGVRSELSKLDSSKLAAKVDLSQITEPGERIAQLMIAPVVLARFLPSEELGSTDRGEGGFGSTGRLGGQ